MGGKSRKGGGTSKKLIERIKQGQFRPQPKKEKTNDKTDQEGFGLHKKE